MLEQKNYGDIHVRGFRLDWQVGMEWCTMVTVLVVNSFQKLCVNLTGRTSFYVIGSV